jgi:hypothetical protein
MNPRAFGVSLAAAFEFAVAISLPLLLNLPSLLNLWRHRVS